MLDVQCYCPVDDACQDPTAEMVKMNKMFYPKPWLDAVGFFQTVEVSIV